MAPTAKSDPQRILIVLHGSIGDVTRALPLAGMLRRAFPGAFLAWSVEPACLPLLQGNSAIDDILLFDRAKLFLGNLPASLAQKNLDRLLRSARKLDPARRYLSAGAWNQFVKFYYGADG